MPLLFAVIALLLAAVPAHAASAPDAGHAFEPQPQSEPIYAPASGETHQQVLEGVDGIDLFVETWRPGAKDGATPPEKLPTILIATPYVTTGARRYTTRNDEDVIDYFTARGYAVAQHHIRGTGSSGGCLEQTGDLQIDDVARVIEWLGRDAPWANGNVGMYGISYDGETQVSVAGRGDPARTKYLKAIIPSETVGGQYEYSAMDGVPYAGQGALSNTSYQTVVFETTENPVHLPERVSCLPELYLGVADTNGDMTPFWKEREYRTGAPAFKAATLWLHGFADWNVMPITVSGFFDRLPDSTPHKALLGQFEHNYPDRHAGVQPEWSRPDWLPMALAWYDRYLKGLETGVEAWPPVQLQGTDGQWRVEADYPTTGGPVGHLALGPEGELGASAPAGSTSFLEGPDDGDGTHAVFETQALGAPLHLTGMPVVDLWLTSSLPDAHLTAKVQVIDGEGNLMTHEGGNAQEVGTFGARSLQHLEPMPENYFTQAAGTPAPVMTPIRVPLRLQPVDLVVPIGGKLRVTIAGSTTWARATAPGGASQITLLHDCEHTSALRFLTARPQGPYLNVREGDEGEGPLTSAPGPEKVVDAGGLASAPVCGKAPERLAQFGPEKPIPGANGGGQCFDLEPPTTRITKARVRRRGLLVRGRSSDTPCGAARIASVRVVFARRVRGKCKFFRPGKRPTKRRRCHATGAPSLKAKGTTRWVMKRRVRLKRGRYRVWALATDPAGNAERARAKRRRVR